MARFTVKVKDAEYPFDGTRSLLIPEAAKVQSVTGMTFGAWEDALGDSIYGNPTALQGLVFILKWREDNTVRMDSDDVANIRMDDIAIVANETPGDAADPLDENDDPSSTGTETST